MLRGSDLSGCAVVLSDYHGDGHLHLAADARGEHDSVVSTTLNGSALGLTTEGARTLRMKTIGDAINTALASATSPAAEPPACAQ